MNDVSGIIETGILEVLPDLSEISLIASHGPFVISKAKRYGKWIKLKSLSPEVRGDAFYEELLKKEFSIGISLDHPNIARTDSWLTDDTLGNCIQEEYVNGLTLDEWMATNPSRRQRRRIADQLLRAVEYIHSQETVHRDIKPSNIIITAVGSNVKLIDFGLSDSPEYAILKQRAGTSGYMAPEVLDGPGNECDWTRADIYSLGVVLNRLGAGLGYGFIARRAMSPQPSHRCGSVKEIIRRLHLIRRGTVGFCALIFSAILVSATVLLTLKVESGRNRMSEAALEAAYNQADSALVEYYSGLEKILYSSEDAHEWNVSSTEYFTSVGYPVQFVDSITGTFSSINGLDEDAVVKLHNRLTARMNSLHNDSYAPKITERWNK